jgi:hypothetical protein
VVWQDAHFGLTPNLPLYGTWEEELLGVLLLIGEEKDMSPRPPETEVARIIIEEADDAGILRGDEGTTETPWGLED